MSPEQLGGQTFGPASDLFSLGVVLVEAATGINPMKGESGTATMRNILRGAAIVPSRLQPNLTPAFDAFVARLLSPKPDDRWADAGAARAAFERIVADGAAEAPRASASSARTSV
jgi:serine/threonine-protein kinase